MRVKLIKNLGYLIFRKIMRTICKVRNYKLVNWQTKSQDKS